METTSASSLLRFRRTNARASVLTWLAVGLGTFIGIFEIIDSKIGDKNKKILIQIGIIICIFSFYMIFNHMGDIYYYRNQLEKANSTLLAPSIQSQPFITLDYVLQKIVSNQIYIIISLIPTFILLEYLLYYKLIISNKQK